MTGWRRVECGNPEKRLQARNTFLQKSSMHGLEYVCSKEGSSVFVKTVQRLLFGVSLALAALSVVSILRDSQSTFVNSMERDVLAGLAEDPDHFPTFPRVTVCRQPAYSTADFNEDGIQLMDYVMLSFGFSFTSLSFFGTRALWYLTSERHFGRKLDNSSYYWTLERNLDFLEEQYQDLKSRSSPQPFNILQFVAGYSLPCGEVFHACAFMDWVGDCCGIFEHVVTTRGVCWSLRRDAILEHVKVLGEDQQEFEMELKTPPTQADTWSKEFGFRVMLTSPSEPAPVHIDSRHVVELAPGNAHFIRTQLEKTQSIAVHTPWHGLWHACPKLRINETHESEQFSLNDCYMRPSYTHMINKCGCLPLQSWTANATMRLCEPRDWTHCYLSLFFEHAGDTENYKCIEPCVSYKFKTEVSAIGVGENGKSISKLRIIHNTQRYVYNVYEKTTIAGILSQIGGSLGLYLGASIITIMELLIFVVTWTWYRLAPANHFAKVKPSRQHFAKRRPPLKDFRI